MRLNDYYLNVSTGGVISSSGRIRNTESLSRLLWTGIIRIILSIRMLWMQDKNRFTR